MKLLRSTENKISKSKKGENVVLVLVHCNIVNNNYQQDLRVLYTFVPNKSKSFSKESYLFKGI